MMKSMVVVEGKDVRIRYLRDNRPRDRVMGLSLRHLDVGFSLPIYN